jgi:putative transposase
MPRIPATHLREQGMVVNKKLIHSIMRKLGIKGLPGPKKHKKNMVNQATEEDLDKRNFTVDRPNVLCLTDITNHPTRGDKVYRRAVLDSLKPPSRRLGHRPALDRTRQRRAEHGQRVSVRLTPFVGPGQVAQQTGSAHQWPTRTASHVASQLPGWFDTNELRRFDYPQSSSAGSSLVNRSLWIGCEKWSQLGD